MPTVTIELTPEARAILQSFRTLPTRVAEKMKAAMDETNQEVLGQVTKNRFTGRGPFAVSEHRLGVRTSRLRTSLRTSKAVLVSGQGLSPTIIGSIGSNVVYLGVHERGFTGEVTVRAFTRKNPRGDVTARFARISPKTGRQTLTRRKIASGISRVRSFSRKMNIPARAPLTTGIEENLDVYSEKLSAAVIEAMKE